MRYAVCLLAVMVVFGCQGKNRLEDIQTLVPVYTAGQLIRIQHVPDQAISIMQYELNAQETTEEKVIGFYKKTFAQKGWKLKEIQTYAGDGSVFTFLNNAYDSAETVTIQTIIRDIKKHGKLKVIINLHRQTG